MINIFIKPTFSDDYYHKNTEEIHSIRLSSQIGGEKIAIKTEQNSHRERNL